MNKLYFVISLFFICTNILAQNEIPSRVEFDNFMEVTVKQLNEKMSGSKIDEGTTWKVATYNKNKSLFTYFYISTVLTDFNINKLNDGQVSKMKKYYVQHTCSSTGRYMKQYNIKVAHIVEDKKTGKVFFTVTVSHADC